MKANDSLLSMRNICVSFNGFKALKGVDFEVQRNEIHALVGEHRAGKSTLVKLLSGVVTKEDGDIIFDGRKVEKLTPETSMKAGIGMVYQNPQVISSLSTVEYLFAGRMIKTWYGCLDLRQMRKRTRSLLSQLELEIDIDLPLARLSVDQRYMVELARAALDGPKLLIFDEISNKLTPEEMEIVYRIICEAKRAQRSVIYITHNMDEIFRFADRVTILKDGFRRGTEAIKDLDRIKLIKLTYSFVLSREELQKSNINLFYFKQYNEAIIKNLPIGVVILDSDNKSYLVNFAATKNLGIEPGTAGDGLFDRLLSLNFAALKEEMRAAIANREQRTWEAVRYRDEKYLTISVYPFYDEDHVLLGTIILVEDITRERRFKEYLLRTEKIASIENLAAGIAHEINNPLGIIQNYIQIVKSKRLETSVREKVVKIEREFDRIVDIVGNLLSFSKLDVAGERQVDLSAVIAEVLSLLKHKMQEKRITVKAYARPCGALVSGDENRLKQLFMNLLVNSIEAVVVGGTIGIEIDPDVGKRTVDVRVIDDGCGIPEAIMSSIFEPFYSTKVGKKNTGLGLAICRHIAELHRGQIACKSSPGERTVFSVQFPLCANVNTEERLVTDQV